VYGRKEKWTRGQRFTSRCHRNDNPAKKAAAAAIKKYLALSAGNISSENMTAATAIIESARLEDSSAHINWVIYEVA
jgi:hypothetical protein